MQTCDKCGKSFELADEGELYAPDESEPCSPFMSLVELCGKCCEERDKEYELYGTSPVTITINGGDMIKRYDLVGEYDFSMGEITDGDYVLYSDHLETITRLRDALNSIQALVDKQAEDEGLFFIAKYATEEYLMLHLRQLHAVIELHTQSLESDDG